MVKIVIDSHPMIVFLNREAKHEKVKAFLKNAVKEKARMIMSAINFGEIYYVVYRAEGKAAADSLLPLISAIPIDIIPPDIDTVILAARYKAHKKMSYADCFTAALAKNTGAMILTGDPEFREVEKEIDIIRI